MLKIWKIALEVKDAQLVKLPQNAEILCVQIQYGKPHLWALVDDLMKQKDYTIYTVGTGHDADHIKHKKYLGTYQLNGGGLVFHVFQG